MGELTPLALENATSQNLIHSSVGHLDLMKVMEKY